MWKLKISKYKNAHPKVPRKDVSNIRKFECILYFMTESSSTPMNVV